MTQTPEFDRVYSPGAPPPDPSTIWILLQARGVLVRRTDVGIALPRTPEVSALGTTVEAPLLLARRDGDTYVVAAVSGDSSPGEEWEVAELRALYGRIPEAEWLIAGYASQVAYWRRTSSFCPICGSEMGPMGLEWRRRCTECAHERYPMVSPAVLALVHDGADRILLVHKPGWGARRSILAGFTLPGESLEQCVHREVLEEAGVRVTDVTYFGSQPWPFPHQLMIGFFARYVSGEIVIDAEELEGAEWHDYRALPPLPPPLSLSRQMIDAWAETRRAADITRVMRHQAAGE